MLVHTLGFSNRSWEETVALLESFEIRRVVDIRTLPGSRHAPQFDQQRLRPALAEAGIDYVHLKALGGLRKPRGDDPANAAWRNPGFRAYADHMQTPEFDAALGRLIDLACELPAVYACTESVFWRCHRTLVSDALAARDWTVRHILGVGRSEPHRLTSFARVEGTRVEYPGEGTLWTPRPR